MHLKLRSAYMFHMFGWALCLSMGVFLAMSAALSGDATHGGNGPGGACCDRRDPFHLILTGYTNELKLGEQHAGAVGADMEEAPVADVCVKWQLQCDLREDPVAASEGDEGNCSKLLEMQWFASARSGVEVPVEEPPPEEHHEPEPEAAEEEADSDSTMWVQVSLQVSEVEGVSLVQRDVNLISGLVMRFQDALSGGDLGLARLRAEHFRKRLHRLRLDENVDGAVADQFEAVCVVAEEAGSSSVAMGYHALEPQLAEWSWAWWRLIEPHLCCSPWTRPAQVTLWR